MTSRQRVRAVLDGSKPDRIPFNFWMDRNLMAALDSKLGAEFRITHYGADVLETFFDYDWHCGLRGEYIEDHKTAWQTVPALGSMEKVRSLNFRATNENSDYIYARIKHDCRRLPDVAKFAMLGSPFEFFLGIRMMENAMTDIYEFPDEVEFLIEKYSGILTDIVKGLTAHCDIDVLYLAGDVCASKGAMFGEDMLRRLMFDPMKPAVEAAHAQGLKVFYHTDGNVMDILHLFAEYGFDGINPLQPHLNDSAAFKRDFNGRLMLYGGLDNCFAIPDNTPDGVRRHVRSQYETLGPDGLIFSSHDIPDYVLIANIDAMTDEIKKLK
ncbi:MAG: hypothetical protein FWG05_06255 [Kiritimatiellaeota bacterium]|nr:hypothetical protein [Kiritimatiellota bacterium]